jgi:aspartate aminotransferase
VIPAELQALLEPLERFEAIRQRAARLGDRLADLAYANPYEGIQEPVRAALRRALEDDRSLALQYSPFGGKTLIRRAVADALAASHRLDFMFRDVILTPGAMSALHLALRTAGEPRDEVIVPVPCWLDYPLYVHFCGLKPVLVPLKPPAFDLDVAAVEDAISDRTCALVVSHPANPTGRSYGTDALEALAESLTRGESRADRKITLIADEAHRDFTARGQYRSASEFFDRTLIVYSFGKYHFMQGQRVGYAAVSPRHPEREAASEELVRWARVTGIATPTAVMQGALPDLLALRHDQSWLLEWRRQLCDELATAGYAVVEPDATMFIYVRTPPPYEDLDFVAELARKGVLALPAPVFHHRGYFRLSLTGSERMLTRAAPILKQLGPG